MSAAINSKRLFCDRGGVSGTVVNMSRGECVNADFLNDLRSVLPNDTATKDEIAESLGAEYSEDLNDAETYPLVGYYIDVQAGALSVYIVTQARFSYYSKSQQGDGKSSSIMVLVPLDRIQRIYQSSNSEQVELVIEVEAEKSVLSLRAEFVSPSKDVATGQTSNGLIVAEGVSVPTSYILRVEPNEVDSFKETRLRAFARALRNQLGY